MVCNCDIYCWMEECFFFSAYEIKKIKNKLGFVGLLGANAYIWSLSSLFFWKSKTLRPPCAACAFVQASDGLWNNENIKKCYKAEKTFLCRRSGFDFWSNMKHFQSCDVT